MVEEEVVIPDGDDLREEASGFDSSSKGSVSLRKQRGLGGLSGAGRVVRARGTTLDQIRDMLTGPDAHQQPVPPSHEQSAGFKHLQDSINSGQRNEQKISARLRSAVARPGGQVHRASLLHTSNK